MASDDRSLPTDIFRYQQAATPSATLAGMPVGRGAAPTNTPQDWPPGMFINAFQPLVPGGTPATAIANEVLPGLGVNRSAAVSAIAAYRLLLE